MAIPRATSRPELRKEKGRQEHHIKSQEKQGNQEARPRTRSLSINLEFSSHNQGKSMNLECFFMRFDVSIACYNKLGQGLWMIKA